MNDQECSGSGFVAIEAVIFTALIIILAFLGLSFTKAVERRSVAVAIAQETARTYVLADDAGEGLAAARQIADDIARNNGIPPQDVNLVITGQLKRGADVTSSVTMHIPAADVPQHEQPATSWTVTHVERVEPYRSFASR